MSARHDFEDFFGDGEDTPVVDTRADGRLYRVPVTRLAPNLVNPRRDFGTEDQLIDFGKSLARRQNQPCPVVSRGAYLKLWPDHGDRIGDVDYVLVSGERRYRAAAVVGLPVLDCVANDAFAVDRRTFMEAVVSENVDRQNFDPVEEAYAVQALVGEFGSNRAVAQHFERVDGWVTQRVLLTHLCREAQDLVRAKSMPLEAARLLGKLARDNDWVVRDQLSWWEEEQERRAATTAAKAAARRAARQSTSPTAGVQAAPAPAPVTGEPPEPVAGEPSEPTGFTAVKPVPPPSPHPGPAVLLQDPVLKSRLATPTAAVLEAVPEPRHHAAEPEEDTRQDPPVPSVSGSASDAGMPPRLPYDDGQFIAQHLIRKMPPEAFTTALRVMNAHALEQGLDVLPDSTV